ncbi:MAG: hypothetical protein WBM86_14000 [Waterburya sp.]
MTAECRRHRLRPVLMRVTLARFPRRNPMGERKKVWQLNNREALSNE